MALRPKQDSYGITRDLKDDYEEGTVLPGAITIPSHKDNMGSQLGRDKRQPIPMIIDPDINGEDAVIITPAKLDANRQLLRDGGDPSSVYKKIVDAAGAPAVKEASNDSERSTIVPRRKKTGAAAAAPKKKAAKSTPAPKVEPVAPPAEEPPAQAPAPASVGSDELSAIMATVGRVAEMVESQNDRLDGVVGRVNELTQELDERSAPPTAIEHEPEPEPVDPPAPLPQIATAPEVTPPTTQVTFQFPASQMAMSSRYHSVLRDGNNLVLVFDTDFTYGDRMQLAPNLNEPYILTVIGEDGMQNLQGPAMYMGQRFTHGNYEYTLFVLMGDVDGSGARD